MPLVNSPFSHPRYTDEQMIAELRRVASSLGGDVLPSPYFREHGRISRPAIDVRFGNWRTALDRAGLKPAHIKGGIHKPCVVCGCLFHGDYGRKSRITCSADCRLERAKTRRTYKGDQASLQAARGRAHSRLKTNKCDRCGRITKRIEVHHKDRNPYNNHPANLEPLCSTCHGMEHRKLRDKP